MRVVRMAVALMRVAAYHSGLIGAWTREVSGSETRVPPARLTVGGTPAS